MSPPPHRQPAKPPQGTPPRTDERKTFKRRPADEAGDVDDFSSPPPAPRPPEQLPRLAVKPRLPGVEPGEVLMEVGNDGEPGGGGAAPHGTGGSSGSSGPPTAGPGVGAAAYDADALDEPEELVAQPVDPDVDPFAAYVALVEQLKAQNGLSGGRIEHETYLIAFDHEALVIAVPDREHEALQQDLDRLARIVRRAAGDDIELRVEVCPRGDARLDPDRNAYRTRSAQEAAERSARCDAARRDPVIMQLVELLDADVVDIHPN